MTDDSATRPRRRDAAQTRRDLLDVARTRFARDGYAATTVREIADEAGVNVALINRYFTSKEGLFEACLSTAVTEVRQDADRVGPGEIVAKLARRLGGSADDDQLRNSLLLLVRSSGDERIDELRRSVLRTMSEKLAGATGQAEGDEAGVLRAQLVLATALGVVLLKSRIGLEPLASAGEDALLDPLADLVRAMLPGERPD